MIGENVEGTSHPLIMRAYEHELPWPMLADKLGRLDEACQSFEYEQVLETLGALVHEYAPARHGDDDLLWRTLVDNERHDVVVH